MGLCYGILRVVFGYTYTITITDRVGGGCVRRSVSKGGRKEVFVQAIDKACRLADPRERRR